MKDLKYYKLKITIDDFKDKFMDKGRMSYTLYKTYSRSLTRRKLIYDIFKLILK
jgi:hypothetical protein